MENQHQTQNSGNSSPERKPGFFQSNTLKFFLIAILSLGLLIPLFMVQNLVDERAYRKTSVEDEITQKWGGNVKLYGPILRVPYKEYTETVSINKQTKETITKRDAEVKYAYFFPNQLNMNADVKTDKRYYGNYEAVIYTSQIDCNGDFINPDFSKKRIPNEDILWNQASVIIQSTNLKGLNEEVVLQFGSQKLELSPIFSNHSNSEFDVLETRTFDASELKNDKKSFQFKLNYRGSKELQWLPIGKSTVVNMSSNWKDPGFIGHFLPQTKQQDIATGFKAQWKVHQVNRPFGQEYFENLPNLSDFAYGVKFVIQVDEYQQNERASKYGFLVIGLTFLTFFLIQLRSKINVNVFHYAMIGLGLILFYTLLISITEHSSFDFAYAIASVATIALISLYSISVLGQKKFALFIAVTLSTLYGFIYVIIQMEDYALLFGSIGLFVILALVMWFSRKIEFN